MLLVCFEGLGLRSRRVSRIFVRGSRETTSVPRSKSAYYMERSVRFFSAPRSVSYGTVG